MDDKELDLLIRDAARRTGQHMTVDSHAVLSELRPALGRARLVRRMRIVGGVGVALLIMGGAAAALVDRDSTTTGSTVTASPEIVSESNNEASDLTAPASDRSGDASQVSDAGAVKSSGLPGGQPALQSEKFEHFVGSILVRYSDAAILYPLQFDLAQGWVATPTRVDPTRARVALTDGSLDVVFEVALDDGALIGSFDPVGEGPGTQTPLPYSDDATADDRIDAETAEDPGAGSDATDTGQSQVPDDDDDGDGNSDDDDDDDDDGDDDDTVKDDEADEQDEEDE